MKMLDEVPVELIDLQGAWRREGRSISDGPPAEVADVLWLQVGRYFCDLRTPRPQTDATSILDMPQAFSGTVQVDVGAISFHHDLDSLRRDPAHPDEGTLHRKDDVMFERGPGFEERWVLVAPSGAHIGCAELRRGGSVLMARLGRVGPVALAVWAGTSPGGAHCTQERSWGRALSLGESDPTMEVDGAVRSMVGGTSLPVGWVVVDQGGS